MSEFDQVFAQSIEPGLEFDDTVFAQQDSDAIDIINHTGKFSDKCDNCGVDDKTNNFGVQNGVGLGSELGPGHETKGDQPNIDSSHKHSAYSNDPQDINERFDEACQELLEELISGYDDGSDELGINPTGDYHDPSDEDIEAHDDEQITNAKVNDTVATRGIDAPIPTTQADIAIQDTNYNENGILNEDEYAAFLEWTIANNIKMTPELLEAAKAKFVIKEDGDEAKTEDIKPSDIKPTEQDKELVDDAIVDDATEDDDIEEVEDETPEKGKVSDTVINDLNSDEDDEILKDLMKD